MAKLYYKSGWEEAKQRHAAWWRGESVDRPLMNVNAPRSQPLSAPEDPGPPPDDTARWLDYGAAIARAQRGAAGNMAAGEGFPQYAASLGPGSFGLFLGSEPHFDARTVWYEPCFDSIEEAEIRFDPNSRWWQWTLEATAAAVDQLAGRMLVGVPDLIENLDTLAALLDNLKLLFCLKDAPSHVHRLQRDLVEAWFEAFDPIYELIRDEDGGNVFTAFTVWGPGRTAKLQCDFSAMIGPGMFRVFVAPYLEQQCDRLDYTVYHLDGPDAIPHLDALLQIESLRAVQWTPGAGQGHGGAEQWDPIYRRTLDAGKSIHVTMPAGEVKRFAQRFGARGVYIHTSVQTEGEAQRLLAEVGGG